MRYFFFYFIFFNSLLFAQKQKNSVSKVDSVDYYLELSNFNIKTNNYKFSLVFAQKAIDYANTTKDIKAQANSYASLGRIYFDLKKYDDAIETYTKSISLFNSIKPSSQQAYAFYNLGLSYMEKGEYTKAEIYFDKAKTIYNTIKIPYAIELLDLQKGIVYRAKGEFAAAAPIFNQIIAKPDAQDLFKTKAEALYQIGTIEMQNNRKNLALNYLNRAYELNSKDKNLEQKAKILQALSSVQEKLLNTDLALKFLKKHI
jgi:tetratricopeptide (TPR) repeat protein